VRTSGKTVRKKGNSQPTRKACSIDRFPNRPPPALVTPLRTQRAVKAADIEAVKKIVNQPNKRKPFVDVKKEPSSISSRSSKAVKTADEEAVLKIVNQPTASRASSTRSKPKVLKPAVGGKKESSSRSKRTTRTAVQSADNVTKAPRKSKQSTRAVKASSLIRRTGVLSPAPPRFDLNRKRTNLFLV
jgi:hypothetical protein